MITGVVLARNEEENIVGCLQSLRPHVSELMLIDMASSDATVEHARPLVDQVLSHPFQPNFDAARNIAIPASKHDWMWFLDADERVRPRTGELVKQLVKEHGREFEALTIPFQTHFCGKWIQHSGWWPGYTMPRVLKRGSFRFAERLHGGVQLDGRLWRIPPDPELAIEHFSYRSLEHYVEKLNRYTSTEAGQLYADNVAWDWKRAIGVMVRDLWNYYERNQGVKDGLEGWLLAWMAGQYQWLSHAKLAERYRDRGALSIPANLNDVIALMGQVLMELRSRHPQLPLGVLWKSPLWDASGYADDGRTLLKAMVRGTRDVAAEEIRWSDRLCSLPAADERLLRLLARARLPDAVVAITNCIPTLVQPDQRAAWNVLRTTFELDRIPAQWLSALKTFQEIWTFSRFDQRAFIRGGVAPEKVHVVPGYVDTELFIPEGQLVALPDAIAGRFVFLSIFDWQLRKGWDVLLRSYVEEFTLADNIGLLMKISRGHGHSAQRVREEADAVLALCGQSLDARPDIVLWDDLLSVEQMTGLYRSCQAFVLPTRGEGFGRPFLEAMACGLPVVGTVASGNGDFMDERNSYPVSSRVVQVPPEAVKEISVFAGGCWHEPDATALRRQLRQVVYDAEHRKSVARLARQTVMEHYSLDHGRDRLESMIAAIEGRFQTAGAPEVKTDDLRVVLEGEFFACHSFANINEQIALGLSTQPNLALRLKRQVHQPTADDSSPFFHRLKSFFAEFSGGPQITIRHAFPPNWSKPATGRWVHIQPWEFSYLPVDWLEPLCNQVDEIWAPSHFVAAVYARSGVPEHKIHVIPWGVQPDLFNPDMPARVLATAKSFQFLFVGGTIARKGFDVLLDAYLAEFSANDDVCLVVKDMGTRTFYQQVNGRGRILDVQKDNAAPEILYFDDDDWTPGQVASLYTACDCLVAPYRGEGFGLPILEAMACGLPVIVPHGGPSDDFVSDETGYRLPSTTVKTHHSWTLCGPAMELQVDVSVLRQAMRTAFCQHELTRGKGQKAAVLVNSQYTWARTVSIMAERLHVLAETAPQSKIGHKVITNTRRQGEQPLASACLFAPASPRQLAALLARLTPFFDEVLVFVKKGAPFIEEVCREYHVRCVGLDLDPVDCDELARTHVSSRWYCWIDPVMPPNDLPADLLKSTLAIHSSTERPVLVEVSPGLRLEFKAGTLVSPGTPPAQHRKNGLEVFSHKYQPHLGERAVTFEAALRYLHEQGREDLLVVETGCVRQWDDWGAGQSTLIFDDFVQAEGGRFISIDIDPENCRHARLRCSASVEIVTADAIKFLHAFARDRPQSIDLLYLDSVDVNWNSPHRAALQQLQEFCAAQPALRCDAIVLLDDHRNSKGQIGKSAYLCDYLKGLGATVLMEAYQLLAVLP